MSRKKLVRNYRIVETVDERGRIRTDSEYIGACYRYSSAAAARRAGAFALGCCLAGAAAFAAALLPYSAAAHTIYVTLPFVLSALPLGLLIEALISVRLAGDRLLQHHADRLRNRLPAASLSLAILAGVSLPGEAAALLSGAGFVLGDGIFLLCAGALTACGLLIFFRRGAFALEEI